MKKPEPLHLVNLLPELDKMLIEVLESLSNEDWERQTIAPKWTIKDIAVHLLDGNLRTLSMLRDSYFGEKAGDINSYEDMVSYLNNLNADWVKATKRLSPKVIIELLKKSGEEYCAYLMTIDPDDRAVFSVGWAGESQSKNWFHTAREYTEKWHHQQQIRFAIDADQVLLIDKYYQPYLATSLRGLPYHYTNTVGQDGDLIKFVFKGNSDKVWFLKYSQNWVLYNMTEQTPTCVVTMDDKVAWRVFTKGIKKEEAIAKSEITGKRELGLKIFDMIAVMA